MRKHKQNDFQQITSGVLNRISSLGDRRLLDFLFYRLLHSGASSAAVVDGVTAFFPLPDCQVAHVSGDRSTGVTFQILPGVGIKKLSTGEQPDTDLPNFQPIVLETAQSFVTSPSDPTNPRIDRVFLKPVYADGNPANVNIIDPNPPNNITSESRNRDRIYSYAYAYVAGTPAASPVAPAPPVGYVAADAIAEILIIQGSGAFNVAQLTDLRTLFEVNSDLVPNITSFPADQVTVSPAVEGQTDAQAALEALETALNAIAQKGLFVANFEYFNTSTVRLARKLGSDIRIEIDSVALQQSGPLDFVLPTHLETGSEAAATRYYCYVFDVAGVMTPRISVTPPVVNPALKMGYHPTNTGWRCVGSFFNDASSNVLLFSTSGRRIRFHEGDAALVHTPTPPGGAQAWTSQAVIVPIGSRSIVIASSMEANSRLLVLAASNVVTALPTGSTHHPLSLSSMAGVLGVIGQAAALDTHYEVHEIPIADPSAPAFKWGVTIEAGGSITEISFRVIGYYDPHLPE